jgi:hypothetical protein
MLTNPIYENIRSIILNLNNLAMTKYCYGEKQENLKKTFCYYKQTVYRTQPILRPQTVIIPKQSMACVHVKHTVKVALE